MNSIDFKERAEAQNECILRWIRATGLTVFEWCEMGYAEAFARAWDSKLRGDALYSITLATVVRVNKALEQ